MTKDHQTILEIDDYIWDDVQSGLISVTDCNRQTDFADKNQQFSYGDEKTSLFDEQINVPVAIVEQEICDTNEPNAKNFSQEVFNLIDINVNHIHQDEI